MYKTTLDPATIAKIIAIPTETKMLIILGAVVAILVLVGIFKMWAAIPLAAAFGGLAYVTYTDDGITVLGFIYAALAFGVLWLGVVFKGKASAKAAAAAAPAHA